MGTTSQKLTYLNETKQELKQKINNLGGSIDDNTTFRNYANQLQNVYDNLPKTEYQTGTEVNLGKTIKGKLDYDNGVVGYGDTSQDGTPTPDSPIEIEVVTGEQSVVVSGKNLAHIEAEGKYRVFSTGNFATNANFNSYIADVQPMTTYITSAKDITTQYTEISNLCYFDRNMNYISGTAYSSANKSFTAPNNCYYVTMAVNVSIEELQVEQGSTATTYEPYITPTTHQLSLGDIELNAIGDYKDELIYDVDEDRVYKNEKIKKKSITDIIGSRTVTYNSTYSQFVIAQNPLPDLANNSNYANQSYTPTFLCNSYKASTFSNALTSTGYFVSYLYIDAQDNRQLRFKNADTTDVNTFISSIANDYLVYPLEQATLTEITDQTLINQVKALYNAHSNNGTTIITSNGDLPMIVKVRGLKGE